MDIKIDRTNMEVSVIKDDEVLKSESLTAEEFKEYMVELSKDDMIEPLRKVSRLFKVKSYTFIGVK